MTLMLGSAISRFRAQKGMTQAQLASLSGIPQPNLSNIEKDKKDLTVLTLVRIAAALEISPSELLEAGLKKERSEELTRSRIEDLAEAISDPARKVSSEIREAAVLFRDFFSETAKKSSRKKACYAWMELKKRFTSNQISSVRQRVQDVHLRKR